MNLPKGTSVGPCTAGRGEHVTALAWIGFMAGSLGTSGTSASNLRNPIKPGAAPPVHDLCIAVGTSAGRLRIYTPGGALLISQRLVGRCRLTLSNPC